MDCHASLIYALLILPELDLEEVRYGQLLTLATVLTGLVLLASAYRLCAL